MRICGYAGMRICGYAGMRICGYAGMRICGYAGTSNWFFLLTNLNLYLCVLYIALPTLLQR